MGNFNSRMTAYFEAFALRNPAISSQLTFRLSVKCPFEKLALSL